MNVPIILSNYWAVILVGGIGFLVVVLKLKKLWKGNLIEWLIDVCAMMEKEFGEKTGDLKLRGAYNEFIVVFPIVSRLVSFKRFSVLVDVALDELKQMLINNKAIGKIISNQTEKNGNFEGENE